MSDRVKRTIGGQFEKGQSGNPAGAGVRKPKPILSRHDIDLLILDVASRETQLRTDRGTETISLLEWNVRALGSGTRVGTAPRAFIDLAKSAASGVERHIETGAGKARREAQR